VILENVTFKHPAPALLPLRVLIVEDDPMIQLGLEQFLKEHFQLTRIEKVTDDYQARDIALQIKPDLIIVDIEIQQRDRITLTQQIKATLPEVGIIVFTSCTATTDIITALSGSADAYCVKGTSLKHFLLAIAAVRKGALYLDPQIAAHVVNRLKTLSLPKLRYSLSQRELEILRLIVEGKSNPEIAAIFYLSCSTVKTHVREIMMKLAVTNRVQAAVVALRSGLV
jgi:two-component system, NarL family, response regulator LiaR